MVNQEQDRKHMICWQMHNILPCLSSLCTHLLPYLILLCTVIWPMTTAWQAVMQLAANELPHVTLKVQHFCVVTLSEANETIDLLPVA